LKKQPKSTKFLDDIATKLGAETQIFDFDQLRKFYEERYLIMKAAPPTRISFEVMANILNKESPIKSRVFTCKGKELAKIYNDYRERIFQENVRYSLGIRSKGINRQILETAKSPSRGKDFWYFNNGITIVCKKINETTNGKVINLDNAQIINGAQTTYALYEAYQNGELRDDIEIIIKAIQSDDREFIENVTLYTKRPLFQRRNSNQNSKGIVGYI
jgi:DNA-directed RNA polymerase subunit N (RpoN/RPB10)